MFDLTSSKRFRYILIVLSLSLVLNGCAGILGGPTQAVSINTIPPAVSLTVDTQPGATYISPAIFKLERNKVHLIKAHYSEDSTAMIAYTPKHGGETIKINCYLVLCISFDSLQGEFKELRSADITLVLPQ